MIPEALALAPGTRLGAYQVLALIGAGAMGEVYRAKDTKLGREVAVKVLPEAFAFDPDRVARFQREAQVLASLNHPNIAALYGMEEDDGRHFLIMELVEGETLAERLREGALRVDKGIKVARQIVDALEAAHKKAVVHRDLKPANIKLTLDDNVKVLDFGLAKVVEPNSVVLSNSPTAMALSTPGTIVGTVAYMSPEQAEGKPLDERSDVFSFGSVLYEILAGRRAFAGDTAARVMSAVLRDEPPAFETPPTIQIILRRCLAKQPDERFRAMGDLKTALEQASLEPVTEPPSIAVLPFASMSPDPENEYFSDGISEEIINALTKIEGLHVAARTSSFSFKGKSVEVGDIARRLNVRHVLEGSVRKAGNRVRVTAQLVDASNGYQLWSERYDRQLADIFDVQDEIARTIVGRLKTALAAGATSKLVKVTTSNMDAYQHYLKGRAMLYRRGPWIARALESFQKAVALDPEYAQAWAGVADAYTTSCYYGYRIPVETMPAALEAATRATVGDPGSAEAHNALAVVALLWERDFEKSEREFLEALALNPGYVQARCWYALFFLQWGVGRPDDGLTEAWRAFEADPLSCYAMTILSLALATVHRFDEAVLQARVAVQHDPESFLARWTMGLAHHWNRQHEEAIAVLEPLWAESGNNWAAMGLVPTYTQAGREDQARRLYQSLSARQAREYVQPFVLAVCATALDDDEAAMGWCEVAVEGRDMLFALFNRWWPDFERVRTDPRFADLQARFNAQGRAQK